MAKTSCLFLLGVCSLSISAVQAQPSSTAKPPVWTPPVEMVFRLEQAGIDDHLMEASRLLGVNLFADSTRFPNPSKPLSGEWKLPNRSLMAAVAIQRDLSLQRATGDSFLLWSRPDYISVARRIAQGESLRLAALPDFLLPKAPRVELPFPPPTKPDGAPDLEKWTPEVNLAYARTQWQKEVDKVEANRAISEALSKYLQEEQGWDGHDLSFSKTLSLGDLPPVLREAVTAHAQTVLLSSVPMSLNGPASWFSKPSHDTARVGVRDQTYVQTVNGQDIPRAIPFLWMFSPRVSGQAQGIRLPASFGAQPVDVPEPMAVPFEPIQLSLPAPVEAMAKVDEIGAEQALSLSDLKREEALQGEVSLELKRVTLSQVIVELKQRGLIDGQIDTNWFDARTVTLRVSRMPLPQFLSNLADLCLAGWVKSDRPRSYRLQPLKLTPVEKLLLRCGAPEVLSMQPTEELDSQRKAWMNRLLDHVDIQDLRAKDGVAVDALPNDLASSCRQFFDSLIATEELSMFQKASTAYLTKCNLRILRSSVRGAGATKDMGLSVTLCAPGQNDPVVFLTRLLYNWSLPPDPAGIEKP